MEKLTLEELKPILKDKWLDYYENNQWIVDKVRDRGFYIGNTKFRELRPEFVLSTVTALEPRLKEFLSYFFLVCDDWNKVLNVLGLDFEPSIELKKRKEHNCKYEQHDISVSQD